MFSSYKNAKLTFCDLTKKITEAYFGTVPWRNSPCSVAKNAQFFRQIAKGSSTFLSLNNFSTSSSTKSAILLRRWLKRKRKQNMIIYKSTLWNCAYPSAKDSLKPLSVLHSKLKFKWLPIFLTFSNFFQKKSIYRYINHLM